MPMFLFWKSPRLEATENTSQGLRFPHAIGFDWLETVPYVLYTFVYLKIHMTSAHSTAVEIQHGNFQRVHASFISTFSIMPRIYTESYLWKYYYFWFLIMISCIMVIGVHHHQQHREHKDFTGYTVHVLTIQTNRIIHAHASLTSMM